MIFQPIYPMLPVKTTLDKIKPKRIFLEPKFDGIRIQVHRIDDQITLYSRNLNDVTDKFFPFIEVIRGNIIKNCVLDGELLGESFRKPWVDTKLKVFDIIYLEEDDLRNRAYCDRRRVLSSVVIQNDKLSLASQFTPKTKEDVKNFYNIVTKNGYEGIVVKDMLGRYHSGLAGDIKKVKLTRTFDFAIVEAEYGNGMFNNMLSNFYLACRDGERLVKVGKVHYGLNYREIKQLTEELEKAIIERSGRKVILNPKIVFEVGFQGSVDSSTYETGCVLRNLKVIRIRWDKPANEINTKDDLIEALKNDRRIQI